MTPIAATLAPPTAPAVPDIVFEHLEESAFLLMQRRRLLVAPEAPLAALRRCEARIDAHRDGLAIAGATAAALAAEQLEAGDPWLLAAAARTWLELGTPAVADVLARLAAAGEALPAWREALRGASDEAFARLAPAGAPLPAEPAAAEAILDARLWRGPLPAPVMQAGATSVHAGVRRAVARHARDLALLEPLLEDSDPGVRERALWSAALANPKGAPALARRHCAADAPPARVALRVLGLFGERADGEKLAARLAAPGLGEAAALALRDLGVTTQARALRPLLAAKDEDLAAAALEAFESLLGPVPPPDEARPLPAGTTPEEAHVDAALKALGEKERRLRGLALAWPGAEADEPLERRWRRAVAGTLAEPALRREIPDGILDDSAPHDVRPGT